MMTKWPRSIILKVVRCCTWCWLFVVDSDAEGVFQDTWGLCIVYTGTAAGHRNIRVYENPITLYPASWRSQMLLVIVLCNS